MMYIQLIHAYLLYIHIDISLTAAAKEWYACVQYVQMYVHMT